MLFVFIGRLEQEVVFGKIERVVQPSKLFHPENRNFLPHGYIFLLFCIKRNCYS